MKWFAAWAISSVVLGSIIFGILSAFKVPPSINWGIVATVIFIVIPGIVFGIYRSGKQGNNPDDQP